MLSMIAIPIITTVRGILAVSAFLLVFFTIPFILKNTKAKHEYEKRTGKIEHLDQTYANLPNQNEEYRFLKITSYPYMFQIYVADNNNHLMDHLEIGDQVDVYFYETDNTRQEQINRFIKFIDKDGKPYFIRTNFQKHLGYVVLGLICFISLGAIVLGKKGKLDW